MTTKITLANIKPTDSLKDLGSATSITAASPHPLPLLPSPVAALLMVDSPIVFAGLVSIFSKLSNANSEDDTHIPPDNKL
ncbi:unnamed protein product [Linum trigynum]|uniref:Uncharacterized protein n=1 Tax=Linum trigynum TaxID=586398 RepID=A0AAV2CUS6_9ROSI